MDDRHRREPEYREADTKRLAYALHQHLYGRHANPAKCMKYNTTPCRECGQIHPCPATN